MMPPCYLTMAEVARVIGWDTRRTRTWLQVSGFCIDSGGERYMVPLALLRNQCPEVYYRVLSLGSRWKSSRPTHPCYMTVAEVSDMISWSRQRTRRWLLASGLLQRRGSRYLLLVDAIRDIYPDVYARVGLMAKERGEG